MDDELVAYRARMRRATAQQQGMHDDAEVARVMETTGCDVAAAHEALAAAAQRSSLPDAHRPAQRGPRRQTEAAAPRWRKTTVWGAGATLVGLALANYWLHDAAAFQAPTLHLSRCAALRLPD